MRDAKPASEAQAELVESLKSYRNADRRKYIHLVDGGISDNLGLRATIDRVEGLGEHRFHQLEALGVKNVLVILVNAAVQRDGFIEQHPNKPKPATTMSAFVDSQMKRYNQETIDRMRHNIQHYQQRSEEEDLPLKFYFSEVSFDHVQFAEARSILNNMPTSLELENEDVDRLIAVGRLLLRREPSFDLFKTNNNGRLAEGAMSKREICKYFEHPACAEIRAD